MANKSEDLELKENNIAIAIRCCLCSEDNFHIEMLDKSLRCGDCGLTINYSIYFYSCGVCGFKEPLVSTKAQELYKHYVLTKFINRTVEGC